MNIISHQENENKAHTEISLYLKDDQIIPGAGEDVGELKSDNADGVKH